MKLPAYTEVVDGRIDSMGSGTTLIHKQGIISFHATKSNSLSIETFCALLTDCWIVPKGELIVA